jgi:predicted  nucleic acid-binding Zn-ribbon protein
MSLSEVVQKLVKVVNNLVDEVGDIEDKTGIYDDKIAALESKSADQAIYNEHIDAEIEEINNTISELPTYDVIEDIRTDINNINSSVADLDTRVTVLEGQNIYQRLDTAEQNIANLGNDIDTLELDVSNINTEISGIKNRIDNLEDCCTDVQENIHDIQGDITTINEDMSDILDDITDVQGDITNINGNITSIQGNITNIQDDITDLQTTVSGKSSVSVRIGQAATDLLAVITVDGTDYNITAQNGYNIWMNDIIDPSRYTMLPNVLSNLHDSLITDLNTKANQNQIDNLFSRVFLDYEKETGENIDYPINQQALSGHLTGSGKSVYIFIPFNKFLLFADSDYSFTISGNITIRAINGYLRDSANTYNFNNIDIATYNPQVFKNELGFRLVLTLPAQASATNNTPVTAYFAGNGKIRITVL